MNANVISPGLSYATSEIEPVTNTQELLDELKSEVGVLKNEIAELKNTWRSEKVEDDGEIPLDQVKSTNFKYCLLVSVLLGIFSCTIVYFSPIPYVGEEDANKFSGSLVLVFLPVSFLCMNLTIFLWFEPLKSEERVCMRVTIVVSAILLFCLFSCLIFWSHVWIVLVWGSLFISITLGVFSFCLHPVHMLLCFLTAFLYLGFLCFLEKFSNLSQLLIG